MGVVCEVHIVWLDCSLLQGMIHYWHKPGMLLEIIMLIDKNG